MERSQSRRVSDRELIERVLEETRSGTRAESFAELVRRYQDRLYNFLLHRTGDPNEAEDIAQEAFVKAFRNIDRFRGESSFFTWLCRIALNELSNRRRKVSPVQLGQLGTGEEGAEGTAVEPVDVTAPEEATLRKEIQHRVHAAIRELPEEFRDAVILVDLLELPYKEAAEVLQVPEGTVKSRLARGRRLLKQKLQDLVEVSGAAEQANKQ